MDASTAIDVRVENQLVRFVPTTPIDGERVVSELSGIRSGAVVIKSFESPRATLLVDAKGRIIVHGTRRLEAARAAAKEMLLRLGLDEEGMTTELGPIVASFEFGKAIDINRFQGNYGLGKVVLDERLGCAIIDDSRHDLSIHVWPQGKAVVSDARHPNMVAMAAIAWREQIEQKKLFVNPI